MQSDPRCGSKIWGRLDRAIGKTGKNRKKQSRTGALSLRQLSVQRARCYFGAFFFIL
jgi:hypothetical protein